MSHHKATAQSANQLQAYLSPTSYCDKNRLKVIQSIKIAAFCRDYVNPYIPVAPHGIDPSLAVGITNPGGPNPMEGNVLLCSVRAFSLGHKYA